MGKKVLAYDLGASGGRGILGGLSDGKLAVHEVCRFVNAPVRDGDRLYWNLPKLMEEIRAGMVQAERLEGFTCVGVDSWGVDFGLIDGEGQLAAPVRCYRDPAFVPASQRVLARASMEKMYRVCGIQYQPFNTVFQLEEMEEELERAQALLLLPDLIGYLLGGSAGAEYTNASTTGLLDPQKRDWAWELIDELGYPRRLFADLRSPGAETGALRSGLCAELGISQAKLRAVASHDTASAFAGTPLSGEDTAILICGTWSLLGCERTEPILTDAARRENFTNESGVGGSIRFLKNIMGLWVLQQCRAAWQRAGLEISFAQLEEAARRAQSTGAFIDVDDPVFSTPGDMPRRICDYCRSTGQPAPGDMGEIARCVYESLALKYRACLEGLCRVTGREYKGIQMAGGGVRDRFLCSLTADVCGVPVISGPAEASALGNLAIQLIAEGELADLPAARDAIRRAGTEEIYHPDRSNPLSRDYEKFISLIQRNA